MGATIRDSKFLQQGFGWWYMQSFPCFPRPEKVVKRSEFPGDQLWTFFFLLKTSYEISHLLLFCLSSWPFSHHKVWLFRSCSDRAGQVTDISHLPLFFGLSNPTKFAVFSLGLHDLLFLLYFIFTIKPATFVAIFTWAPFVQTSMCLHRKIPESYPK